MVLGFNYIYIFNISCLVAGFDQNLILFSDYNVACWPTRPRRIGDHYFHTGCLNVRDTDENALQR